MIDESRPQKERSPELLLLVVVFIWASNFPIAKYGIQGLDIFVFNGIRFVTAFLVFGVLFRVRGGWTTLEGSDGWKMVGVGLVAHVIYQLSFILD